MLEWQLGLSGSFVTEERRAAKRARRLASASTPTGPHPQSGTGTTVQPLRIPSSKRRTRRSAPSRRLISHPTSAMAEYVCLTDAAGIIRFESSALTILQSVQTLLHSTFEGSFELSSRTRRRKRIRRSSLCLFRLLLSLLRLSERRCTTLSNTLLPTQHTLAI